MQCSPNAFACKLGVKHAIFLCVSTWQDINGLWILVSVNFKILRAHRPRSDKGQEVTVHVTQCIYFCDASLLSIQEFTEPIYMYIFPATQKEKHLVSPLLSQSSPSW